jgi:NCS1 family nucleobase:cation symporter-1
MIEQRCIEFIPDRERYGTPRRLFTIWFSANLQVTTLVVGTLGIVAGLNLLWTIVALCIGNIIGTVFMAAHSAQGPHLGIPQMVQSRAQFGVVGAALPMLAVVFTYVLFVAANGIVMREAVKAVVPMTDDRALITFGAASLIIAFIGYELIHRLGALLTVASGVLFLAAGLRVLGLPMPANTWTMTGTFQVAPFLLVVSQSASYALGFGPYVADYSRYLPNDIRTRDTFIFTYSGNLSGSLMIMILGALMAALMSGGAQSIALNPAGSIADLFGGGRIVIYTVVILGVLLVNVLNVYSAFMSVVVIFSGWRKVLEVSLVRKFMIMLTVTTIATTIAIATQYRFFDYFSDILMAQIYVLVPWSSINLTDYYLTRRGKYSVADIFDERGIYGRINWMTVGIYVLAIVLQIPFMSLSFYKGPIAHLVGTDLSWIPGLVVPGSLYYLFMRRRMKLLSRVRQPTGTDPVG